MLSEQLKKDTHKAHIEVEKLILPAIKKLETKQSYKELLQLFYGFFKPLEEKIELFITPDFLDDINERRKSDSILKDLSFLNYSDYSDAPTCSDLPEVDSVARALGVMYVLEGSTLGGVHISKIILEKMKMTGKNGVEFFSGYGSETMEKWIIFKKRMDDFGREEGSGSEVINAANETFWKFKKWIEMN